MLRGHPRRNPAKCVCSGVETIRRPLRSVIAIPVGVAPTCTADDPGGPEVAASVARTAPRRRRGPPRSAASSRPPSSPACPRPGTARRRRRPSGSGARPRSAGAARYWAWLVSWYSSTSTWRKVAGSGRGPRGTARSTLTARHEQVVEVHRVHAVQLALVELVDVGDRLLEEASRPAGGSRRRRGACSWRRRSGAGWPRGEALGVDAELVEARLTSRRDVGLVVDRELARVAEPRRLGAQHPRARRVEGHHPHRPRRVADQQLDALAHLLRGLVREGDREDLARPAPGRCAPGTRCGG